MYIVQRKCYSFYKWWISSVYRHVEYWRFLQLYTRGCAKLHIGASSRPIWCKYPEIQNVFFFCYFWLIPGVVDSHNCSAALNITIPPYFGCGDGVVSGDEECDSNAPCCVNCRYANASVVCYAATQTCGIHIFDKQKKEALMLSKSKVVIVMASMYYALPIVPM